MNKTIRVTKDTVSTFNLNGEKLVSTSPQKTRIESTSTQIGSGDPSAASIGGFSFNVLSKILPSNIVTPITTFVQTPQFNLSITVLAGIAMYLAATEDKFNESLETKNIKPIRVARYQILDLNDIIPETV